MSRKTHLPDLQRWLRFIKKWPNTFDPRGVYPPELRYLLAYASLVIGGGGLLLGLVFLSLFVIRLILMALGGN